jgi:hypothetical protein
LPVLEIEHHSKRNVGFCYTALRAILPFGRICIASARVTEICARDGFRSPDMNTWPTAASFAFDIAHFDRGAIGVSRRGRGGIGRRAGFKIQFRKECGFDSHRPHHLRWQALKSPPLGGQEPASADTQASHDPYSAAANDNRMIVSWCP